MGGEESVPVPNHAILDDTHQNRIVPIAQRDLPKDWKREGHSFVYFVDRSISRRRDTLKKVIHAAGNQFVYNENPHDSKIEFLLNEHDQDILPNISLFRLRFGRQYFVGTAEIIDIAPRDELQLYEELYPMPSQDDIERQIQSIINNEDPQELTPSTNVEESENKVNSLELDREPSEASPKPSTEFPIQKTLQPCSHDKNIIYTCISVHFDSERCLENVCPRVFESFCILGSLEHVSSNNMSPSNIPAVFSKISNEAIPKNNHLWNPKENWEESGREGREARKKYLGVEAWRAALVFSFLEQPWRIGVPNEPIIFKHDVKKIMEQWQAYSQRFMIKLIWMQLIQPPVFMPLSETLLHQDLPQLTDDDESLLLSYCLEYWNKPEMNYLWKMSLKATDDTVAIWKTRMYFYRDEESGAICLFKRISYPIWNVVDEQAIQRLQSTQPPTLQRILIRHIVSSFPNNQIFESLAHSENRLHEESIQRWKKLPSSLQTILFHAILRRYGVTGDMEHIFGHEQCNIDGLRIPYRFQTKNTRADSKAESLVVVLGSIAKTFTYLDLSRCTLSSESLESLGPHLTNVVEMNLSRCSGFMEWSFLLHLRENLCFLNLSYLEQCGNAQQLCAMLAGLDKLQILDLSFSKIEMSHVVMHIPKLSSLTSLNLQQKTSDGLWTVTDDALIHLLQVKTLRCLYLPGHELSATGLYHLVELPHLSELGFNRLVGIGKHSPLASLTQLSSLSITDSEMFDNSLEGVLAGLISLTRLDLSQNEITGEGISALGMMSNLRTLHVANNQIGLNRNLDHQSFSCVPHLTDLDISGNPIVEMRPWMTRKQRLAHLSFLFHFSELRTLAMDHTGDENGIEDGGLEYLQKLTSLTSLSLRKQSLTDRCSRYLEKMSRLEVLHMGQNPITNEAIRSLMCLKNLRVLDIQDSVVSDTVLVHLISFPHLETLCIGNTRITSSAISVLEKQCPYLSINLQSS